MAKPEKQIACLTRILQNLGRPKSGKRVVLCSAMHSVFLHAAPVWRGVLDLQKYRNLLINVKRKMLLRVASAFRMVFWGGLQVITGVTPIDLQAAERASIYNLREEDKCHIVALAREKHSDHSSRDENEAKWSRKPTLNIRPWVECKYRQTDYYLTQALSRLL